MIFRLIAGILAVLTATGGYLSFRYETTSFCEAAGKAVQEELPEIIDEIAGDDTTSTRVFDAIASDFVQDLTGATTEQWRRTPMAARTDEYTASIDDRSAVSCAFMVLEHQLSPSSFREGLIEDLAAGG